MNSPDILRNVDATLLKSTASVLEVQELYQKAKDYRCASVCVFSSFLPYIEPLVKYTSQGSVEQGYPLLCTVLSFPHGSDSLAAKISAAKEMLIQGANEIDYVINISAALDANYEALTNEAERIRESISSEVTLKAIIETSVYQTSHQMIAVAKAVEEGLGQTDFIKTSTGTSERGASLEDIQALRKHLKPETRIKASGGIRTKEFALQLVEAGADRIGASNLEGLK